MACFDFTISTIKYKQAVHPVKLENQSNLENQGNLE